MLYTVLSKKEDKHIKMETQACVNRGERVWRCYREARVWRDINEPRNGVYGVLADWDEDTKEDHGDSYRTLCDRFKVIQMEEVIPSWVKALSRSIVRGAWDEDLLDKGHINPDYATPEQEAVYYDKHKEDVMFQLRCLVSLFVYEEFEARIEGKGKERRGDERQDGDPGGGTLFKDP